MNEEPDLRHRGVWDFTQCRHFCLDNFSGGGFLESVIFTLYFTAIMALLVGRDRF